jgi:hypothetical protein
LIGWQVSDRVERVTTAVGCRLGDQFDSGPVYLPFQIVAVEQVRPQLRLHYRASSLFHPFPRYTSSTIGCRSSLKPSGVYFILSVLTRLFINVRTGVFGHLGNIGAVVQQLDAANGGSQNRTIGAQEAAGAQSEYLGTDYSFPLFVR